MKLILSGVLAIMVIVALYIPFLKKYRGIILFAFGTAAALLSAFQTFRTASLMLPFYHATEQSFYQKEFAEEGLYPDAFIQLLIKNKTVYTKDDLDDFLREHHLQENDTSFFDDDKYWIYQHYHQSNITDFIKSTGAVVKADDSFNGVSVPADKLGDFTNIGYANDMYRYLFPFSELDEEWSNSFYYYWYYSVRIRPFNVYINTANIENADEIVILWDEQEEENLYIMTKEYYDEEVGADV